MEENIRAKTQLDPSSRVVSIQYRRMSHTDKRTDRRTGHTTTAYNTLA